MEILCLMGLFPKEYENIIIENSISGVQNAANKLQWAIVNGLACQENVNVHIINSLFIGSFPRRYRKATIPSFDFGGEQGITGHNVCFLNLPIIKYLSKYWGVKKRVNEWVKSNEKKERVVLAYAMTSPVVELLHYIGLTYPEVKCILFVPDLPEYMNVESNSALYDLLKKKHINHLRKNLNGIDGYILLTEHMKEWFPTEISYTVIEGIYNTSSVAEIEQSEKREKTILYAGGLYEAYGILDLVKAFEQLDVPDWKLELIGDGDLLPMLRKISEKDKRIILRGLIPNQQVVARQRQVSILVNPRNSNQKFTKYSFPSKTIEYMASGTPMVGYKLSGMPEEYCEFFYEIPAQPNGLISCLKKVIDMPPQSREEMGRKAKNFITEKKNEKKQCSKIIELIDAIK